MPQHGTGQVDRPAAELGRVWCRHLQTPSCSDHRYRSGVRATGSGSALLDRFLAEYNQHRPHRSLPHRATPATLYETLPKALPGPSRTTDTHDRIRHDRIDKSGTVTLRVHGQLRHIGIGRTHKGTHVILLIQDLEVRIVNAITGELLRELTIDTNKDYQPQK